VEMMGDSLTRKNIFIEFNKTNDIFSDMRYIIDASQKKAHQAVNVVLVYCNWLIGYRIVEEILNDNERAGYGSQVIKKLFKELTKLYGKGFDKGTLCRCYRFYNLFPEIVSTVWQQSGNVLSWSHYRILIQVEDKVAREWYANEALNESWSVRTLQRNVSSQYYYRLLKTQKRILKKSIITNIQKFLMELEKEYAFVARQQHIHTEKQDYYIDLVFYNYYLKCFVLIDLKTSKVTHQDVGQMDMYVRMYDELKRTDGDNPTIGIILCSDTDEDIARYSILKRNEQLFASKYKLYLPTEEELRNEIEIQKTIYRLQHDLGGSKNGDR
jgi:predicted nuclease of restriction endonuclease-like (RecB) superfamily